MILPKDHLMTRSGAVGEMTRKLFISSLLMFYRRLEVAFLPLEQGKEFHKAIRRLGIPYSRAAETSKNAFLSVHSYLS